MQPNKKLSKGFENILPASLEAETYKDVETYLLRRGIGFAYQNKISILAVDAALVKMLYEVDTKKLNAILTNKRIKLEVKDTSHKTYKKALEFGLMLLNAIDGN